MDHTSDAKNKPGHRIVLYSHDTMGLGHIRRNLLIAQCLVNSNLDLSILLIAGAVEANSFALPQGIDWLTLPALHKVGNGHYKTRSLKMPLDAIIDLRQKTVDAALEAFDPDVLVVDKVPRGVQGELDVSLERLRRRGKTRCVLGLRDILDDAETVRTEWEDSKNEEAIRDYFDEIWVYGDPAVHNLAAVHGFSLQTAEKIRYTGYFDKRKRLEWAQNQDNVDILPADYLACNRRLALCTLGGGEDGGSLGEIFAKTELPADYHGLIVTGPFMPSQTYRKLQRIAALKPRLKVIKQLGEPTQFMRIADRIIAMGGYNAVSEAVSFGKHTLIVPRVHPRQEQLIRAEQFRDLGLVDYLHPDDASPEKIADWLARDLEALPPAKGLLDMNGLDRLPHFLNRLLTGIPRDFVLYDTDSNGLEVGSYVV